MTGLMLVAVLLSMLHLLIEDEFQCPLGNKVNTGLGDGIILQSCSWEKTAGKFVRTGPLQLVRNGILILQLQNDRDGKLQGEYTSWDDDGNIMENGHYRDGLKEGEWQVTDKQGNHNVVTYSAGIALTP